MTVAGQCNYDHPDSMCPAVTSWSFVAIMTTLMTTQMKGQWSEEWPSGRIWVISVWSRKIVVCGTNSGHGDLWGNNKQWHGDNPGHHNPGAVFDKGPLTVFNKWPWTVFDNGPLTILIRTMEVLDKGSGTILKERPGTVLTKDQGQYLTMNQGHS